MKPERIKSVIYKGRLVYIVTYTGLKPDEMVLLQRSHVEIARKSEGIHYYISDFNGCYITGSFMQEAVPFLSELRNRYSGVLLGITGPKLHILKGVVTLYPDFRIRTASNMEEGLEVVVSTNVQPDL